LICGSSVFVSIRGSFSRSLCLLAAIPGFPLSLALLSSLA
jgi:hypothetical protein